MYSGVLEGWLLMGLNALSDQVNWYLLLLLLTSSAACLGLTSMRCPCSPQYCCISAYSIYFNAR